MKYSSKFHKISQLTYHFFFRSSVKWCIILYFSLLTFSPFISSARPFVLVCDEQTNEDEYNIYLSQNSDSISYIEFLEAETGQIKQDNFLKNTKFIESSEDIDIQSNSKENENHVLLPNVKNHYSLQLESNNESNSNLDEITNGFLSSIRKLVLLTILKKIQDEPLQSPASINNYTLQVKSITEGVVKNPGSIASQFEIFRKDDRLYINGILIKTDQLKSIKFYPQLFYHIAYLSNVYKPFFQWTKGDKIKSIPKEKLVSGDCQNVTWTENVKNIAIPAKTLFIHSCTNKISLYKSNPSLFFNKELPKDLSQTISYSDTTHKYWSDHPFIIIGGSLLIFSLFQKEFQKTPNANSHFQITF